MIESICNWTIDHQVLSIPTQSHSYQTCSPVQKAEPFHQKLPSILHTLVYKCINTSHTVTIGAIPPVYLSPSAQDHSSRNVWEYLNALMRKYPSASVPWSQWISTVWLALLCKVLHEIVVASWLQWYILIIFTLQSWSQQCFHLPLVDCSLQTKEYLHCLRVYRHSKWANRTYSIFTIHQTGAWDWQRGHSCWCTPSQPSWCSAVLENDHGARKQSNSIIQSSG